MELSIDDMVAFATAEALRKRLDALLSTKNKKSMRAKVDKAMKEEFLRTGNDRRRIFINGHEVGYVGVQLNKPVPEHKVPRVTNYRELAGWFVKEENLSALVALVEHDVDEALKLSTVGGEIPDGVEYVDVSAEPASIKGVRAYVNPDKVAAAYGTREAIDRAYIGVLGSGDDA